MTVDRALTRAVGLTASVWILLVFCASAQNSSSTLWQPVAQFSPASFNSQPQVQADSLQTFSLNYSALEPLLANVAQESTQPAAFSRDIISLPMPDGTMARFRFVESPIMEPELAKKFPELKTYVGQGIDDPMAIARFDLTPAGLHAQILSPNGAVYLDPYYAGNTNIYACYFKRDYHRAVDDFQCFTADVGGKSATKNSIAFAPMVLSGATLRTYRLACAATGEYTTFFGGTVGLGLSAIVTAINRVTGIYETELAIRLILVANNDQIVYTNATTDPYSNGTPGTLLSQNQSNLDFVIGSANYDIGHVFGTSGGGLAGVGVVCVNGLKAYGETGMSTPIGDAFYVDYVAHEMGHQFGAHHTFNSTNSSCGGGNMFPGTAYEPGSGSTIMAYAGICGADNLQAHSDPYFHSASFEEIENYVTIGNGSSCGTATSTGNSAPTVSAGSAHTIPGGTPFTLTASGSDPNGDTLTYCWEERDLGPPITLTTPDDGSSPLFRSFSPVSSASRTFPKISDILNNTATAGEMFPTTSRTMQFRVTARDNKAGGGGVNSSDTQVTIVTNGGPFTILSPSNSVTWVGSQSITWNPAGTTNA
ncbi:MAG TPA: zinc-dependent metalloprotease family protein, partial [Candidatus Dormibacteraeota bacterium]|nr:zinc-dependent metalloprotease family protein [Candidatus Dormibacteraeota bacterium]